MTDTRIASNELLPCPFCGGNAQCVEQEDEDGRFAAIVCLMCGAGSRQHYFIGDDARDHVKSAWNKRTIAANLRQKGECEVLALTDAKERELFENFMRFTFPSCPLKMRDGLYENASADLLWKGWQARASIQSIVKGDE